MFIIKNSTYTKRGFSMKTEIIKELNLDLNSQPTVESLADKLVMYSYVLNSYWRGGLNRFFDELKDEIEHELYRSQIQLSTGGGTYTPVNSKWFEEVVTRDDLSNLEKLEILISFDTYQDLYQPTKTTTLTVVFDVWKNRKHVYVLEILPSKSTENE